MVITTPSTAATMPRPGSASATVLSAAIGCVGLVVMDFHIEFHHLVQFEAARRRR